MRYPLCLLLLGCLLQLPVLAQDQPLAPEDDGFGYPLYIVVSVTGRVGPVSSDELLPEPLIPTLEKLLRERQLAKLDMGEMTRSDRVLEYTARFVFRTLSELRAWYAQESTQALLEALKEAGGGTELAINVERRLHAGAFSQQ